MSLIPFAPFSGDVGIGEIDAVFEAGFVASANLECFRCDPDFPTVQLLQYLSFLPAIFRGLRQKLRRSLRGASFAPPPQSSGLRSNRHCFFRCVLLPVLSWGHARNRPHSGSFCSSTEYPTTRRIYRLQVTNRLPAPAFGPKPPLQKPYWKCSSQAR